MRLVLPHDYVRGHKGSLCQKSRRTRECDWIFHKVSACFVWFYINHEMKCCWKMQITYICITITASCFISEWTPWKLACVIHRINLPLSICSGMMWLFYCAIFVCNIVKWRALMRSLVFHVESCILVVIQQLYIYISISFID